jgi:hypothetical protein
LAADNLMIRRQAWIDAQFVVWFRAVRHLAVYLIL